MGWFKTKVAPWFESKEQRKKKEENAYEAYMREHDMVPITVPVGQFSETRVKWITREEAEELKRERETRLAAYLAGQEADRKRWKKNLEEAPAREKAAKEKEKRDRIAACRALVAEANAAEAQVAEAQPADVTGGYRRRRMTKRKRQNKTKRSRK